MKFLRNVATATAALLLLANAAVAEPMTSLARLRQALSSGWHASCETVRGETVAVNLDAIFLPQADVLPVLKVELMPPVDEKVAAPWHEGMTFWSNANEWRAPKEDASFANEAGRVRVRRLLSSGEVTLRTLNRDELNPSRVHETSGMTIAEAAAWYDATISALFPNEDVTVAPYAGRLMLPAEGSKAAGGYWLYFRQAFHGIPLLGGISMAFSSANNRQAREETPLMLNMYNRLILADPQSYYLADINLYREKETVYEDIPLAPAEAAFAPILRDIQNGLLRQVDSLELGYAAYLDESDGSAYWLLPVWLVTGLYFDSATEELSDEEQENPVLAEAAHLQTRVINAQTAEMYLPDDGSGGRSVCPGIVLWDGGE